MPAFEHEGPFVFQLKSSLALGRGEAGAGGGFWPEVGTRDADQTCSGGPLSE